jgi:hypothetical protein
MRPDLAVVLSQGDYDLAALAQDYRSYADRPRVRAYPDLAGRLTLASGWVAASDTGMLKSASLVGVGAWLFEEFIISSPSESDCQAADADWDDVLAAAQWVDWGELDWPAGADVEVMNGLAATVLRAMARTASEERWPDAADRWRRAGLAQVTPEHRLWLAQALVDAGDVKAAAAFAREFSTLLLPVARMLGRHNPTLAATLLRQAETGAAADGPELWRAWDALGQPDEARAVLRRLGPATAIAARLLAEAEPDEARRVLRERLEAESQDHDAAVMHAALAIRQGLNADHLQVEAAARCGDPAVAARAFEVLSRLAARQGDVAAALQHRDAAELQRQQSQGLA